METSTASTGRRSARSDPCRLRRSRYPPLPPSHRVHPSRTSSKSSTSNSWPSHSATRRRRRLLVTLDRVLRRHTVKSRPPRPPPLKVTATKHRTASCTLRPTLRRPSCCPICRRRLSLPHRTLRPPHRGQTTRLQVRRRDRLVSRMKCRCATATRPSAAFRSERGRGRRLRLLVCDNRSVPVPKVGTTPKGRSKPDPSSSTPCSPGSTTNAGPSRRSSPPCPKFRPRPPPLPNRQFFRPSPCLTAVEWKTFLRSTNLFSLRLRRRRRRPRPRSKAPISV